jgi:hypothetical protein
MNENDLRRALKALGNIPVERLEELCKAEREGKIYIMPVAVDSEVWVINATKPPRPLKCNVTVAETYFWVSAEKAPWGGSFTEDDVNEKVFYTREAAEAALKENNPSCGARMDEPTT